MTANASAPQSGLSISRFFTTESSMKELENPDLWELRDIEIKDVDGKIIFEKKGINTPKAWSQMAITVAASKYFDRTPGKEETSVWQVIHRIASTIAYWGFKDGYFNNRTSSKIFYEELFYLLINQMYSFNSPVWFNVGINGTEKVQTSACFILSVEDTMESILDLAKTESMLFKHGSGCGTNLSKLRGSMEPLSNGGKSSGPLSFMRGYDAFAGVIRSGGKTRRSAKMQILNVDHPDIIEFITVKGKEEKKAWALIDAGYDGSIDGEAYASVAFQNSNFSVRVTDEFMRAVEEDEEYQVYPVNQNGPDLDKPIATYRARDIFRLIAESTHLCGDPGMQFHDTVNHWNTLFETLLINASNPCSEFCAPDDSACNLASFNLIKFKNKNGTFDLSLFKKAVKIAVIAQDILINNSTYPLPKVEENAIKYRPLGLGYANLGAFLMSIGLPYDSEEGRNIAAAITSCMTAQAFLTSTLLADILAPFATFEENKNSCLKVIKQHIDAHKKINDNIYKESLSELWHTVYNRVETIGLRNSQVSLLAPTGTIGFLMDCDTTGVEPDIALIKYKTLSGGGILKLISNGVKDALAQEKLGYSEEEVKRILKHIEETGAVEGAEDIKEEHLSIFDCAFKSEKGTRSISPMGHLRMMAAVQPFLSGAISKTVNVEKDTTVEEIEQIYMQAWKLGLKAVAIYRNESKRIQPLNLKSDKPAKKKKLTRTRLADERPAINHKFSIAGNEGYINVGLYPDGTPGEVFIHMAKEGSTISGLMDAFATSVSIMLQSGVPLPSLVEKFSHMHFEPSGMTTNENIRFASSIIDYIFKWLKYKFIDSNEKPEIVKPAKIVTNSTSKLQDGPPCSNCGHITVRSASCANCPICGTSAGCG